MLNKSVIQKTIIAPTTISGNAGKTVMPTGPTTAPPATLSVVAGVGTTSMAKTAPTVSSVARSLSGATNSQVGGGKIDIDRFIDNMMNIGKPNSGISTSISEQDIMDLLLGVKELFMEQPMMLELDPPLAVCGDIHGQLTDLLRIFGKAGFPNTTNYLFLGDYIDRGRMNLEVILMLFAFKIKYPNNFFLLRGNHETQLVNRIYGFYEELNRRYKSPRMYHTFQDVFNCMPLSALIGDRILCMHGGLSPDLYKGDSLKVLKDLVRPLPDPPNPSLPLDLLWADPDHTTDEFKFSIRGVSCTFGPKVVNAVCSKFNIDLICRAHQVVQDGYEFFNNRKLVTIFSAPHYCGQFDNAAAVMIVNKELQCSFKVFRPKFPNAKIKVADAQLTTYGKPPGT
uniref:Serine/threonine-protein phosphatase n=1 Tax=Panagrellus redivivus TaxID=6233 RepID=A0A7E4UZ95_PANRE